MRLRHPQLKFRKIQKLGMLHVGSPRLHLTGAAASDKPKKLLNMPDLLAESVGSVFSCFSLSWPLLVLRLDLLSESIRWRRIVWTLEATGDGLRLRFAPLYDLPLYLLATGGFVLRLRDLFSILFAYRTRMIPFPVYYCIFFFTDLQIQYGCVCGTKWAKVGSKRTCRRHGGDRASSPITPPSLSTLHPPMSAKQPAHRRKGGSVEVVDSKYAVDLATQQSYSENVFLFVPNLIG
jgi:hypothetical protein